LNFKIYAFPDISDNNFSKSPNKCIKVRGKLLVKCKLDIWREESFVNFLEHKVCQILLELDASKSGSNGILRAKSILVYYFLQSIFRLLSLAILKRSLIVLSPMARLCAWH